MIQYAKPFSFIIISVCFLSVLTNCNKSTPFGAELLEDQAANIAFTSLPVATTLMKEDSVFTSDPTSISDYFLCGKIDEPIFGQSEAVVYTSMRLSQFGFNFDETATVVDVEMLLGFSGLGFYGDSTVNHTYEVHRLEDTITTSGTYYSNQTLAEGDLLGSLTFMPTPGIGMPLIDTSNLVTSQDSSFGSFIRIPLDNAFGQEILDMDSLTLSNDTVFINQTRGLAIRSLNPGSMLGLNLNNSFFSNILIRYTEENVDGELIYKVYKIRFSGTNKFVHFEHDRPSTLTSKIGVQQNDDMYAQGLAGLRTLVKFDSLALDTLSDVIVNKAELVMTVNDEIGVDPSQFDVPEQFILTRIQGDTIALVTADVTYAQTTGGGALTRFGGSPKIENGKTVYRLNMSEYFQNILNGVQSREVYINMFPQATSPYRALFYGADHPDYPLKLELKYTKNQ